ncbi:MAG: hypothetical protein ABR957_04450 [Terracidiphilus sp.]|jgi:hypothetical protein
MTESLLQTRDLPDTGTCWALLERIASSSNVKRAARLQGLLFYLGKCSLKDGLDTVHEQRIGVEVFGRSHDYDTSDDNIVRTNVSELRKRVEAYFEGEGANEPLVVEIPRGSYLPVFRYRPVKPQIAIEIAAAKVLEPVPANVVSISKPADAAPVVRSIIPQSRWVMILAAVIIVALAATCIILRFQYRSLYRSMYPWQSQPAVAELWSNILDARPDTDIVLADASFGLLQDINKKSFQFNDYLSRSYISQLQTENASPDLHAVLSRISVWNLGDQDDFKLARRILALDPLGTKIHLYNARGYLPDLTKRDNVILIGGRISNPWDDLFEGHMNFVAKFSTDGPITVVNRAPTGSELAVYTQTDSTQYCVVSYQPNPDHNGVVLLIEGTGAEATEAAGDFLLSDDQLSAFKKLLRADKFPYFDVLLKVSSVPGTPLTATVEAYRSYPNLH